MDFLGQKTRKRQTALVKVLQTAKSLPPGTTPTGPDQPHTPEHPGSDSYPYNDYTVGKHRVWHIKWGAVYPTTVTYLIPVGTIPLGGFPIIAVSPGKFLDHPALYTDLLKHICLKGYIVLFVDADTGPLDCEHSRMATEFLQAVWETISKEIGGRTSSPAQIGWWGHSMGAKVQALAATMGDNRYYLPPTLIIANNFSNSKGELCNDDAIKTADKIPANIRYTLIEGEDDNIAAQDPQLLYNALAHLQHRQLIEVVSYKPDDLIADHLAPLAGTTLPGIKTDVDALDWWLYWKVAVGAFDFHFKKGSDKWAYGSEVENGGTDHEGYNVRHKIVI